MRKVETRTTPSGRTTYQVRFRYGTSPTTGKPSQTSETFTDKAEATQFAKWLDALGPQAALDLLHEDDQAKSIPFLDDVAAAHIEHLTGIEAGSRLGYTRLWARTWSPLLGQVRADHVSPDDVRRAVNALAGRYSTKSLQNQRGLLSGVLNRCIEQGHLVRNPAKGIRLPQGRRVDDDAGDDDDDDTEMVILTHGGFTALLDAFQPHYRALLRFLVGTGCRWGEAIVLRVKDFDLANRTVRIRRALKWSGDGKRVIGPPKTKKGRRTIVLPAEVVDDVRPLLPCRAGGDLVFTAPRGGMISHRTFWSKNWRPAIWRAQHCPDHTPADCRCGSGEPHRCRIHETPPPPCRCPGTLLETPASTTCATPTPHGCSPPASRSTSSRPASGTSRSRPPSTPTATSSRTRSFSPFRPPRPRSVARSAPSPRSARRPSPTRPCSSSRPP